MADEVTMTAQGLMREADRLSGAHPGLTTAGLSALFAGLTREKLLARHRVHSLGATRDSEERGKLAEAISTQVAEEPSVKRLIKREFPNRFPMTPRQIAWGRRNEPGRPKLSEEQKRQARREASRAYRARKREGGEEPKG